jgi:tetratricopeptide (TPR) repeat protein
LAIVEKAEGSGHPQFALILNNLAGANLYLGKTELGRQQYGRVLEIVEKAFGKDDPTVASFLESMARVYRKTGLNEDAEDCEKRADRINKIKR